MKRALQKFGPRFSVGALLCASFLNGTAQTTKPVSKIYLQADAGAGTYESIDAGLGLKAVMHNKWSITVSYRDLEMKPKNLPSDYQPETDYLRKSKTQKTFAWILTGAGVTAVAIGLLTQDYVDAFTSIAEVKNSSSPAVYAVGGACIAGGVVLFVASSKNKRKAEAINAFFNMEKITEPRAGIAGNTVYPALGLRLRWR